MYNARYSQCLLHLEYVERLSLVRALGCTDDDQLLIKYLEAAIKPDSKIRYTDYQGVYRCRYLGVASTSFFRRQTASTDYFVRPSVLPS